MARPAVPKTLAASASPSMEVVSGNPASHGPSLAASAAMYRPTVRLKSTDDRRLLAQWWQIEVYRHLNLCGEARYAVTLFANMAARAEMGVSEGSSLGRKAVWVNTGVEVDVFAELAPTVRERKRLIRSYMTHYVAAGECYLIARTLRETDPGYAADPGGIIWEIVGVTSLRRMGDGRWQVRHDNDTFIDLAESDPIIRLWNPDPDNPREAWSPMRSLLPTLNEIEFLTKHIFTQVQSRLMSSGVWFLPENLTFAPPPASAVEGGEEAIAEMNEAERFMVSLAATSMQLLDGNEVAFPTVVMADSQALASVEQNKLIKFWSEIDESAMTLRSDAVRRFALGWDLPPEQVLGASGLAVTGAGGSAGSVNHWGVWANEEQTIANHIEPALDALVDVLTVSVIKVAVPRTDKVIAYDTASLRLRQDRSKESIELFDRGELKGEVMLRENGFDPEHDRMTDAEWTRWMLTKIAGGSATPDQVTEALRLLGVVLNVPAQSAPQAIEAPAPGKPGRNEPRNLDDHPYEGPPREQHDHSPAPFTAFHAAAEGLVLRALEKSGARLLNGGKRGRDRDRTTPPHLAHLAIRSAEPTSSLMFDFSTLGIVMEGRAAGQQAQIAGALTRYCREMYANGEAYSRSGLIEALKGLA